MKEDLEIITIEPAITDHCNLNCAYCDHFSPLASKGFYDLNQFERDIKNLAQIITSDSVSKKYKFSFQLLGGEPLLNKDLYKYIEVIRQTLDVTLLEHFAIITNGSLLNENLPSDLIRQFNECPELTVVITEYLNSKINYSKVKNSYMSLIKQIDRYKELPDSVLEKTYLTDRKRFFTKVNLDFSENNDFTPEIGYFYCLIKNHCMTMRDGRVYPCSVEGNYKFLRDSFNTPDIELDYFDLQTGSREGFLKFLHGPWSFCKYCKPRTYNVEWKTSNRQPEEWLNTEDFI